MLPSLLFNLWHIHDYVTQALKQRSGTGEFIAPWITKRKVVITCDPMNVLHITSKNFSNYDKGPIFREIFKVLGKGILSDAEEWKHSRGLLHSLFKQKSFGMFLDKVVKDKVQGCLLPFLDHHAEKQGSEVDLQDVFNRFTFDNACYMVLGFDPCCLSIELPQVVYEKFFSEAQVALFHRCVVPRALWKLQKWLGMGKERKMSETQKISELILHEFVRCKLKQCMVMEGSRFPATANIVSHEPLNGSTDALCNASNFSREATSATTKILTSGNSRPAIEETDFELLSAMVKEEQKNGKVDEKLIRDTVINILSAGKDTLTAGLTWFFWLVATHPSVEAMILQELKENFPEEKRMVLRAEQVEKLWPSHRCRHNNNILFVRHGTVGGDMGRRLLGVQAKEVDFREG
ncbi:hypothetical protein L6164_023142 [Bauhinia variegata]|uniref:Uncharacterized protein n=1 Tax=Bauhinia variegata TaxID=167791 RepID=A0ACB9MIQ1_BAUVA|nr:hypothetical protein L6164_023142 [Bauhinia variegata]